MLEGQPLATLSRMVDPNVGLASVTPIFSLSAAREWLDRNGPKPEPPAFKPERFPPKEEYVSPEERERRVTMLKRTAQVIRETVRAKTVGRPKIAILQTHDPRALIEASQSDLHAKPVMPQPHRQSA